MELWVQLICQLLFSRSRMISDPLSVQGYVFKQLQFYMNVATSKLPSNEDYVI